MIINDLEIGAPTSIIEIQNESMNLQFCRTCQEILERNKQKQGVSAVTAVVIPKPSERITRVLKFMDNFIKSREVVIAESRYYCKGQAYSPYNLFLIQMSL